MAARRAGSSEFYWVVTTAVLMGLRSADCSAKSWAAQKASAKADLMVDKTESCLAVLTDARKAANWVAMMVGSMAGLTDALWAETKADSTVDLQVVRWVGSTGILWAVQRVEWTAVGLDEHWVELSVGLKDVRKADVMASLTVGLMVPKMALKMAVNWEACSVGSKAG